jgi:hypothetical protein
VDVVLNVQLPRSTLRGALAAHPQRVGHPVDVIEPGGDQSALEDRAVIEARATQAVVM